MRKGYAISLEGGKAEIQLMETDDRLSIVLSLRTMEGSTMEATLTYEECENLRGILPRSDSFGWETALRCDKTPPAENTPTFLPGQEDTDV